METGLFFPYKFMLPLDKSGTKASEEFVFCKRILYDMGTRGASSAWQSWVWWSRCSLLTHSQRIPALSLPTSHPYSSICQDKESTVCGITVHMDIGVSGVLFACDTFSQCLELYRSPSSVCDYWELFFNRVNFEVIFAHWFLHFSTMFLLSNTPLFWRCAIFLSKDVDFLPSAETNSQDEKISWKHCPIEAKC